MKASFLILSVFLASYAIAQQNNQPCPCCTEEKRQFDFWVGDWVVYNTGTDQEVGRNTIEIIENGCGLRESWTGASGGTGTSYNYYDPVSEKWNQLWLSSNGYILKISGGIENGAMVMISEPSYNANLKSNVVQRISWTPDEAGNVRQLWDQKQENSEEWQVLFDGTYKKIDD